MPNPMDSEPASEIIGPIALLSQAIPRSIDFKKVCNKSNFNTIIASQGIETHCLVVSSIRQ